VLGARSRLLRKIFSREGIVKKPNVCA
jgi:hypothetical protein